MFATPLDLLDMDKPMTDVIPDLEPAPMAIEPITQADRIEALLERVVLASNSQTEVLNWLAENTQGLFAMIGQMNAAGGPAALLGMMGNNHG